MNDNEFDELFQDAARTYNSPPEAPREVMWVAIERSRATSARVHDLPARRYRWLSTAAGIAAVLMVGVLIGRQTREPSPVSTRAPVSGNAAATSPAVVAHLPVSTDSTSTSKEPVAFATSPKRTGLSRIAHRPPRADLSNDETTYRLAVVEHLARTEVLLTDFRAHSHNGDASTLDAQFAAMSSDLLSSTRYLLATRHTGDAVMTRLLQDLELVLMQISQYATDGRRIDLDAANQSIERRNVLPKLRSSIPAGGSAGSGT